MTSAESAVRAQAIELLARDDALEAMVHGIFDGTPPRASAPYVAVGTADGADWGIKDRAGRVEYRAAALQDLTAIKAAEQELRDADRRKDEFLATLAHELRNPLAPIRNAAEILKSKGDLDPQLAWGRDVIDRQVRIMTRLLDDLLEISRISRNRLELRRQRVTLAAVIDSAVASEKSNVVTLSCTTLTVITFVPISRAWLGTISRSSWYF